MRGSKSPIVYTSALLILILHIFKKKKCRQHSHGQPSKSGGVRVCVCVVTQYILDTSLPHSVQVSEHQPGSSRRKETQVFNVTFFLF